MVTREIVRGKLLAVADEMGVVLARSSMSPVIYEVLDFACGFCDADGELVSQTNGITVFTGTFSIQVNIIKEKFGDRIRPGDIYMLNDPYHGGTHYNDVGVVKPVFVDGELFAFAISISHWTDIGGKAPGSLPADATEVFQEGICFPGIHIYKEGERQDAIVEMVAANVRLPKMALGDLNARAGFGPHRRESLSRALREVRQAGGLRDLPPHPGDQRAGEPRGRRCAAGRHL